MPKVFDVASNFTPVGARGVTTASIHPTQQPVVIFTLCLPFDLQLSLKIQHLTPLLPVSLLRQPFRATLQHLKQAHPLTPVLI